MKMIRRMFRNGEHIRIQRVDRESNVLCHLGIVESMNTRAVRQSHSPNSFLSVFAGMTQCRSSCPGEILLSLLSLPSFASSEPGERLPTEVAAFPGSLFKTASGKSVLSLLGLLARSLKAKGADCFTIQAGEILAHLLRRTRRRIPEATEGRRNDDNDGNDANDGIPAGRDY